MYLSRFHSVNIYFRNWKLNAVMFLYSNPWLLKTVLIILEAMVFYSLYNVLNSTLHLVSKLFLNVALAHLPLNLTRYHQFMVSGPRWINKTLFLLQAALNPPFFVILFQSSTPSLTTLYDWFKISCNIYTILEYVLLT